MSSDHLNTSIKKKKTTASMLPSRRQRSEHTVALQEQLNEVVAKGSKRLQEERLAQSEHAMPILPRTCMPLGNQIKHMTFDAGERRCRLQYDNQVVTKSAVDIFFPSTEDMEHFQDMVLCWNNRASILSVGHIYSCTENLVKESVDVVITESPSSLQKHLCHFRPRRNESIPHLVSNLVGWKKAGVEHDVDTVYLSVLEINKESDLSHHSSEEDPEEDMDSSSEEEISPVKDSRQICGLLYLDYSGTRNLNFEFREGTRFILVTNVA